METGEEPGTIHETAGDNFLRGTILNERRAKRLGVGRKIGLSYWRHGRNSACRSPKCEEYLQSLTAQKARSFYDNENYQTIKGIGYDVAQPGMGLERENFHSFVNNTLKEQAVRNYFVNKRNSSDGEYKLLQDNKDLQDAERASEKNVSAWTDAWTGGDSPTRRLHDRLQDVRSALLDMVQDPRPEVRAEVAENPNTPAEAMWVLASDGDAGVRAKVAANANTPLVVLEALANDENIEVEEKAVRTLRRLWAKAHEGIAAGELSGIARLPELSQQREEKIG